MFEILLPIHISKMRAYRFLPLAGFFAVAAHAFWLGDIPHQGVAPYASSGYPVFRDVRKYGAVGDGNADDTAAIQRAIDDGQTCGRGCVSPDPLHQHKVCLMNFASPDSDRGGSRSTNLSLYRCLLLQLLPWSTFPVALTKFHRPSDPVTLSK